MSKFKFCLALVENIAVIMFHVMKKQAATTLKKKKKKSTSQKDNRETKGPPTLASGFLPCGVFVQTLFLQ